MKKHGFPDDCDCASEELCLFIQTREAREAVAAPIEAEAVLIDEETGRQAVKRLVVAIEAEAQKAVAPQLLGWRTEDYLMETADPAAAKNWEPHYRLLPIFEGDPYTKLAAPTSSAGTEAVALTKTELEVIREDDSLWSSGFAGDMKLKGDEYGEAVQRALAKKNGWRLGGADHG